MQIRWLAPPAIAAIALCASVVLSAQEVRPQFGSRVEVARIQVSVVDEEGRFVPGLGPEDFEVRVAGEARRLVDLLAVTVAEDAAGAEAGPAAQAPPGDVLTAEATSSAGRRTPERRHFVLFLDLSTMNFRSLRYAKRIMAEFVDRVVEPEDRVGLVVYSPVAGLQWLVPATSRHGLFAEAIDQLRPSRSGESIDTGLSDLPSEIDTEGFAFNQLADDFVALEAEDMVAAVAQVGQDMAALEARKHLVMLSRGYGDGLYRDPGFVQAMDRTLEQIRRTDVVVHTVFPDRLGGRILGNRSFLYQVADETGGTSTWFQHNADRGMQELDRATRSYYVLSIPVQADDPDRLPLDVRMLREGVTVRWAPVEIRSPEAIRRLSDMQRQIQVAAALDPGFDPDLMSFALRVMPLGMAEGQGRFAVLMQMETDELSRLAAERGDGSLQFELLGIALQPGGQVGDVFQSRLQAEDRARDAVAVGALRYLGTFSAPPGRGLFKLLLREASLGKLSARSAGFFVPEELSTNLWAGEPLRVLGSAMADVARSARIDDDNYPLSVVGRRMVPDLTPLARAGTSNRALVVLSHLAGHPITGQYQLLVRATLTSAGERPLELEWVRLRGIEPAAEANMFRALIEFELPRSTPSGEATLTLVLADAVSGSQTTTSMSLGVIGE